MGKWSSLLGNYRTDSQSRDQVYDFLNKIIFEIQNGNTAIKEMIGPFLDYRYPSQIIAMLTEGLFTFLILFFLARKSRQPGYIAGRFIICYAVVRIFNELFRMPDIQIGYQLWDLTRGQWISIAMLFFGFIMSFYWSRTQSQTIHGWLRGEHVKLGARRGIK